MLRSSSRMSAFSCALLALLVPATSQRRSVVRAWGAHGRRGRCGARGRPKAMVGNGVVVGDAGYVEFGTQHVSGPQGFAKKINGKWQKAAPYHRVPEVGAGYVKSTTTSLRPAATP
jgi:hypothetical protein